MLFLAGFIKKACIADGVAPTVDRYFAHPANFTAMSAWIGVLFYAIQIYCDFSGYTDMAIAAARLLGYQLPNNFQFPYFARNVSDFWRRWHISLSSWLRDYLYIPLGGNRGSRAFAYRNVMITMLLGGLWHGAAWTFVIWGALHGTALLIHRQWTRLTEGLKWAARAMRWLAWPITIYAVCVAWIFFRAHDLSSAGTILKQFTLFHGGGNEHFHRWFLLVIVALALIHWLNSRRWFARIMATVACSGLRGGLRLHFCSGPFICSAPLHALHLFSVLSLVVRKQITCAKKIVAANWKMNMTQAESERFVDSFLRDVGEINDVEVVIIPPFTAIAKVSEALGRAHNIKVGAQNMYWENSGAFTGEISAPLLRDLFVHYVVLGHSERRTLFGETDEMVNRKVRAAHEAKLRPIVCVGETLDQRDKGNVEKILSIQLRGSLAGLTPKELQETVIAYEPVWAIGTGRNATAQQAQEAHAFIRHILREMSDDTTAERVRIQYGGSVKPENARELMSQPDIDGALVGGASLDPRSFAQIVKAARQE